jgi:hypothetical protein
VQFFSPHKDGDADQRHQDGGRRQEAGAGLYSSPFRPKKIQQLFIVDLWTKFHTETVDNDQTDYFEPQGWIK